ncbi:MAG: high-potential iron-sulfur protein [Steroidobacteraceae bacterium]
MSEQGFISRREALKQVVLLCGVAGALAATPEVQAADLPHLTPDDPTAKALGYHDDAKTVDSKQFATYKPDQTCSTCQQLQGTTGQSWRPCNIFPGKAVNANGWCQVWVKKG